MGETANPKYSRMTIVATGDEQTLDQIAKQLEKLIDVVDIKVLEEDSSVDRELMLIKIRVDAKERQDIITMTNVFRGNVVDIGSDSVIVELTGQPSKLDAFLNLLEGKEILELARTGLTGLSRGSDDVRYLF